MEVVRIQSRSRDIEMSKIDMIRPRATHWRFPFLLDHSVIQYDLEAP